MTYAFKDDFRRSSILIRFRKMTWNQPRTASCIKPSSLDWKSSK